MRAIALVLVVAACGGGADAPADSGALAFCVSETNRYRAMAQKPGLTESTDLETYAAAGAMHDFSTMAHDHFTTTNGGGIASAENECPQQGNWTISTGEDLNSVVGMCIQAFYAEGPGSDYSMHGHYINMMGDYTMLGCGIYESGGKITIVQDYGN